MPNSGIPLADQLASERARLHHAADDLLDVCDQLGEALPEGHQDVLDVLGYVDVRLDARLVSDLFAALKKARA